MKAKDELVSEAADIESRRNFFTGLGKWSAVVIGGILMGTEVWTPKKAHACDFCCEEPTPRKFKSGDMQPTMPGASTPTMPGQVSTPSVPSQGGKDIQVPKKSFERRFRRKR